MLVRTSGVKPLAVAVALCFTTGLVQAHNNVHAPKSIAWAATTGDDPVDAGTAARLATLTNQLVATIGEYQAASGAKRAQITARLKSIAQERNAVLGSTLARQPGLTLRSSLPNGISQSLPADVRRFVEREVKVSGKVVQIHGDDFVNPQGVSDTFYIESSDASGRTQRIRLHAADRPLRAGMSHPAGEFLNKEVTVTATAIGDQLLIAGAQAIAEGSSGGSTTSSSTTIAGAALAGAQNTLVLTGNFTDKGLSCAATDINNKVFGTTNSVADFYRQTSNGNVTFNGTMYGPYQMTAASTDACNFQAWSAQLENQAAAQGINLNNYPRRIFVFPTSSCGIGYGTVGGSPSRAWIFRCDLTDLFTHEVGHNLGFQHASTASDQYGDRSDVMGYSGLALRQNNAPNKYTTGWFGSSWTRSVAGSGIFTLDPTATPSPVNPQVLTVAKPDTGDSYFISFRQPIGYDTGLSSSYQNLVSIHRGSTSMGQYTYLLGTVGAGGSYTDSTNGYTFAVNSVGTSSATVSVTINGATCTRAAPTVTVSPVSQSAASGKSIGYQMTVTNNNSPGCGTSSFAFTSVVPSGWSNSTSPASVSLGAGSTAGTTWTVTSAANATQASYPISSTAYDTGATSSTTTSQAAYIVTAADIAPPTVAITSPANGAVLSGNKVTISAEATDDTGVAKVEFYVDGQLMASDTATPYSYSLNLRRLASGTHSIAATAYDAAGNRATSTITVKR